jgi:hypothetical protein
MHATLLAQPLSWVRFTLARCATIGTVPDGCQQRRVMPTLGLSMPQFPTRTMHNQPSYQPEMLHIEAEYGHLARRYGPRGRTENASHQPECRISTRNTASLRADTARGSAPRIHLTSPNAAYQRGILPPCTPRIYLISPNAVNNRALCKPFCARNAA